VQQKCHAPHSRFSTGSASSGATVNVGWSLGMHQLSGNEHLVFESVESVAVRVDDRRAPGGDGD